MYSTAFILYCADLFLSLYNNGLKITYIILKYSHLMKNLQGTAPLRYLVVIIYTV